MGIQLDWVREFTKARSERLTEAECVTTGGHKLLVSHDNSDGADNIHGPGTHIGNGGFLVALHALGKEKGGCAIEILDLKETSGAEMEQFNLLIWKKKNDEEDEADW